MSQRVIRYEGEGRARRPVYADEGPASASSSGVLAEIGRLSVLGARGSVTPLGGAGEVERRQATEAQRAAWARHEPVTASSGTQRPTDAAMTQASRQRGAQANRARAAAARASQEEDVPMTDTPQDPIEVAVDAPEHWRMIGVLAEVAMDAEKAYQLFLAAAPRWEEARARLLEAWEAVEAIVGPTPHAVRLTDAVRLLASTTDVQAPLAIAQAAAESPHVDVEASVADPEPIAPPARSGALTTFQRQVVEATLRHRGDRKAVAAELGVIRESVERTLERVGKKGYLPIELIPLLPARFAQYAPGS